MGIKTWPWYTPPPMKAINEVFPFARILEHVPCFQVYEYDTFCAVWVTRFLCGVVRKTDSFGNTFLFLTNAPFLTEEIHRDFITFLLSEGFKTTSVRALLNRIKRLKAIDYCIAFERCRSVLSN